MVFSNSKGYIACVEKSSNLLIYLLCQFVVSYSSETNHLWLLQFWLLSQWFWNDCSKLLSACTTVNGLRCMVFVDGSLFCWRTWSLRTSRSPSLDEHFAWWFLKHPILSLIAEPQVVHFTFVSLSSLVKNCQTGSSGLPLLFILYFLLYSNLT